MQGTEKDSRMVETFGANRGLTPTVGKGVKRRNIRYTTDDSVNRNDSGSKDTKEKYKEQTITRIKDIEYYLGSDWIDWNTIKVNLNNTTRIGAMNRRIPSVPMRCDICDTPFETKAFTGGKMTGNKILPESVFRRVPLLRGECGMCDG